MKSSKILLLLVLGLFPLSIIPCEIKVYFSPSMEVLEAIIDVLESAENTIDACVYTFTNRKIAYALVRAHRKGVRIRVIIDKRSNESQYTKSGFLRANGIDIKIMSGLKASGPRDWDGLMHHKFAVIDDKILLTGSLNWTASAISKNHENLLIMKDCSIAIEFIEEFSRLWEKD